MTIEIDNKKMWESLLYRGRWSSGTIFDVIEDALKDQGLEYKNGEIVSIEQKQDASELAESEDEKIRKDICTLVTGWRNRVNIKGFASMEDILAWLEKQGALKPVEWSEEDKNLREATIGLLNLVQPLDAKSWGKSRLDCIDWLKSLRPQKKQEWSKEDIEMIDWLIRCCEKEHEELCNNRYGHQEIVSDLKRDCRKKWDWLESLKSRLSKDKE